VERGTKFRRFVTC